MPDGTSAARRARLVLRPVLLVLGVPFLLAGMYALVWFSSYQSGSYVVGVSDLEACRAIARRFAPDQTGLAWSRRDIPPAEQGRVPHERRLFGLLQSWTESGTVEAVGTRDGRERLRVAVGPGPFGIGWTLTRISYPPPP